MNKLAINPETQRQIEQYQANPAQVLAISGQDGSGQSFIAQTVAAGLLGIDIEAVSRSPYVISIGLPKDKKEIPIEAIRELIARLRVKAIGRRVVIIDPADAATREAQNSLLKTLEQTPGETYFILAISRPMLPTVMSRAQLIIAKPITLAQAKTHYDLSNDKVTSAWNLSEGAAGLLHELLTTGNGTSSSSVEAAKAFIAASPYERAVKIDDLCKDRQDCLDFLESLAKVVKALHHAQIKKDNPTKLRQFVAARRAVDDAMKTVSSNGSAKLALLNLVVNLTV